MQWDWIRPTKNFIVNAGAYLAGAAAGGGAAAGAAGGGAAWLGAPMAEGMIEGAAIRDLGATGSSAPAGEAGGRALLKTTVSLFTPKWKR